MRQSLRERLRSITPQDSHSRNQALKFNLQKLKQDTLRNLREQVNSVISARREELPSFRVKFSCPVEVLEAELNRFVIATENICAIFFAIMMEESYLSLNSEEELMNKAEQLKQTIEKNWVNIQKELNRSKEQLENIRKKIKKREPKKGRNCKISVDSTYIMQRWLLDNFSNPYPSHSKKIQMAKQSRLSICQVNNWFINARERVVKKFYKKETLKMLKDPDAKDD